MHNGKMTHKRKAYGTKWDKNTILQADTTQSLYLRKFSDFYYINLYFIFKVNALQKLH